MKITVSKVIGFCFGVRRAIDISLKESKKKHKYGLYMLGEIVHNENVVRKLDKAGIKAINNIKNAKNGKIIIRSHGVPPGLYKELDIMQIDYVDTTCPKVSKIHKKIKELEMSGYYPVILGDAMHDEVIGIRGQVKKATIIDSLNFDGSFLKINKKIGIVCQSTQDINNVKKIVKRIKEEANDVKFINTICESTKLRQASVRENADKHDVVLIIGSKHSANTMRLYDIAKVLNSRTYIINFPDKIKKAWFKVCKSVFIASGASTPDELIQKIFKKISQMY